MSNYGFFKNYVIANIISELGSEYEGAEVTEVTVEKNNATVNGICVRKPDVNIAPNIYPEAIYNELIDEYPDEPLESICKKGVKMVADAILAAPVPAIKTPTDLLSLKESRNTIYPRIIGTNGNEKFLGDKAVYPLTEGTAVIFLLLLNKNQQDEGFGYQTVTVTNQILDSWGISIQELYDLAVDNAARDAEVLTMGEIFSREAGGIIEIPEEETPTMIVISSAGKFTNGGVLSQDVVNLAAARLKADKVYLLPSSVYEFLAVDAKVAPIAELKEMVRQINATQVAPEERVVDDVFSYDYDNSTLSAVA